KRRIVSETVRDAVDIFRRGYLCHTDGGKDFAKKRMRDVDFGLVRLDPLDRVRQYGHGIVRGPGARRVSRTTMPRHPRLEATLLAGAQWIQQATRSVNRRAAALIDGIVRANLVGKMLGNPAGAP